MATRTSEEVHQNVEDILPELNDLIVFGKKYHEALQNALEIASQFYHSIEVIGKRISSLPGSVTHDQVDIDVAHKVVAPAKIQVDSLLTDFLGPLEMKIREESKAYKALHKNYKQSIDPHQQKEVKKQEFTYKKKEKKKGSKSSRAHGDSQYLQAYNDSCQTLENMRKELGLQEALVEEKKFYCSTMKYLELCNASNAEEAYAKSHKEITKRISDLLALASEPNKLPGEGANLGLLESATEPSSY